VRVIRCDAVLEPVAEVALSEALLVRVANGELPATLRVYRPRPTVAFGKLDALRPGYAEAARAARDHGFTPVLRSPGGHAAAYDEGTVGFDLVVPAASIAGGVQERFRSTSDAIARALVSLGVDARVGEVPGEYCRGDYTVNARGRTKLVGTAQRAIRGGALLAGFVTVSGAGRLRAVLEPVYAALDLAWDPATLGAVEDEDEAVTPEQVEAALRTELAPGAESATLDDATRTLARELEPRHAIRP
jgi:lipoate-protein ligase A